jgi:hypothetical protein
MGPNRTNDDGKFRQRHAVGLTFQDYGTYPVTLLFGAGIVYHDGNAVFLGTLLISRMAQMKLRKFILRSLRDRIVIGRKPGVALRATPGYMLTSLRDKGIAD